LSSTSISGGGPAFAAVGDVVDPKVAGLHDVRRQVATSATAMAQDLRATVGDQPGFPTLTIDSATLDIRHYKTFGR
jgi:hypothetical protein